MLKRGVFAIILVLLISIVYAQSSLKGDFNNDKKVDLDDFFLFAEAFRKCNEKERICNVKFDLDFNYDIDVEDFFIFAEEFGKKAEKKFDVGENCKEVFPGFNGPPNERVNLVFMSFNYENIDKFLEKVKPLVNINDDKNSFFAFEPVKSNKNKFNLWYVGKGEQSAYIPTYLYNPPILGGDLPSSFYDFKNKVTALYQNCNIKNPYPIVVFDSGFRSYGGSPFFGQWIMLSRDAATKDLVHEFAHFFGKLSDEYDGDKDFNGLSDANIVNCDKATLEEACPKWCKGKPIDVDKIKQEQCIQLSTVDCLKRMMEGSACFLIGKEGALGKANSCINIIAFCTSIQDKNTCKDTTNNFYLSPQCTWVLEGHAYYKARCIPVGNRLNIGTQCIEGTGCYNGCALGRGLFRSEQYGMLQREGLPLGVYNEKLFCDRIKAETGTAGGKCDEIFELFK